MLIQAILIVGVVFLFVFFLRRQSEYGLRALSKISMIFFVITAIFVVIFPDSSNSVAHFVGVSRGADLLLYIMTLLFVFVVLNMYVARKKDQQRLVLLARKLALLEAELKEKGKVGH